MKSTFHPLLLPVRTWCPAAILLLAMGWGLLIHLPLAAQEEPQPIRKKAPTFEELFGDPVVAEGQGVAIKESQLDKAFMAYKSNLAARGKQLPAQQRSAKMAQLLDRMIITRLLTNRASKIDRTVAKGLADKFFEETKQSAGSDAAFERQLRLTGLTVEQFNQRILEQALAESVIDRELKSTITVTDDEVRNFYEKGIDARVLRIQEEILDPAATPGATPVDPDRLAKARERVDVLQKQNLEQLTDPEKVRVAHILLATRIPGAPATANAQIPEAERKAKMAKAESLVAQIKGGADFMALVKEHSEDRRLQETGGEYTFSRQDRFAPEFMAASFSLKQGEVSDVVTTVFGFHIIKSLEVIPPAKPSLVSVEKDIRNFMTQQKLQVAMPKYFAGLKEEAKIKILDPRYQMSGPSALPTTSGLGSSAP